jgi:uncharacterized protein Smg (DUF494 family)
MYERIIEIIVYVISELKNNRTIGDIDIEELHSLGYTNAEISTALSWLIDRMEFSEKYLNVENTSDPNSFRLLHEAERDLFTNEAWGEIIQLNSLGLLTNEHIETLIEKAVFMGTRQLNSEYIKHFVANSIFNIQPGINPFGSRIMLQGNDTIN